MIESAIDKIKEDVLDSTDVVTLHPLIFVSAVLTYTAGAILFGATVAPSIAAAAGLSIVQITAFWLLFSGVSAVLGIYRQVKDDAR